MERCTKCSKILDKEFFKTLYGEVRCADCYDDYLMTDKGKVEYLIGLASGELELKDYDADFLGHVSVCWRKYKDELNLPLCFIKEVEEKACELGIL